MANLIIQALQVTLPEVYTDDATLGLYTVSGVSYLRWSEAPLSNVAETWNAEILLKNGIGDITASADLSRGGNIAQYSGTKILATNAESLKGSLDDLGINLIGLSANITEFIGTATDSDATSRTVVFTGIVEDVQWGDTTLSISLKNSLYKRETNISTVTSEGVTIPVTFGKHSPVYSKIVAGVETTTTDVNNLAKFVRTNDTYDEETYKDTFFTGVAGDVKIFPVTNLSGGKTSLTIRASANATFTQMSPEDTYCKIVDGDGKDSYRQVTEFIPYSGEYFFVLIDSVFYTDPSVLNDDTRSWVQFVKIGRDYESDGWICEDFLKAEDGTATDKAELNSFVSDSNKFNRIADFGFDVLDTNNNKLEIDGQQYSEDIDNLDSFIILPCSNQTLETDASITTKWPFNYGSGYPYKWDDGIYSNIVKGVFTISTTYTNASYSTDKNSTTYSRMFNQTGDYLSNALRMATIIKFDIPELPQNVDMSSVHFGIKGIFNSNRDYKVRFVMRRFAYTKTTDYKEFSGTVAAETTLDCLPDFYYSDVVSTANFNFYKTTSTTGYTTFILTGITKEIYKTFSECAIILETVANSIYFGDVQSELKIYELAVIFKLASSDIKKEIYSPLSGRIYNDTWSTRKAAANLIESPKDIIEHCKRLQNWSEIASHTVIEWGKSYSSDALIKTSDVGSFDSTNLDYLATQSAKVCMQVTDKDKQTTTAITRKLCDSFGLCSYIDKDGYECLTTTEPTSPSETITLADVIGGIGDVIEPQIENIYCEPVVNYLFNQGSGKYDRSASVTNIGAAAWQASYTPGYTLADGVIIWNTCKALYQKYRQIELCPSEFSDQSCIADYATMVNYVKRKLSWMDKQRLPTISLAYSKGKDYVIFQHVLVLLPTHTRNSTIECMIEKITKDKNSNLVKIDLVVLGTMETAWYDTSDSTNEKVDTADDANEAVIDV